MNKKIKLNFLKRVVTSEVAQDVDPELKLQYCKKINK
jgi:hypothetical protein